MKRVKGFHFNIIEDKDVIEYIEKQPNQSNYIKGLVRKDIQGSSIEEIVRQQIEKYLEGIELKTKEKSVRIDTEEVLNILNL